MSKRDSDSFQEGPPSKMLKDDDGGGRAGRVRKKSAKVLEMEEFEQAEKKTPGGKSPTAKKVKTPKVPSVPVISEDLDSFVEKPTSSSKKSKPAKAISVGLASNLTSTKIPKVSFKLEPELTSPTTVSSFGDIKPNVTNIRITSGSKIELGPEVNQLVSPVKKETKSVIKHLLSSPAAGSTKAPAARIETPEPASTGKKVNKNKKTTPESQTKKKVVKQKKTKIESLSASEEMSQSESDTFDTPTPSLKMKIISSSNPASALVSMGSPKTTDSHDQSKQKKVKKVKKLIKNKFSDMTEQFSDTSPGVPSGPGSDSYGESKKPSKKVSKKPSKKKEKLIQDAISSISAAKQMPNLAALVAIQGSLSANQAASSTETVQVTQKAQKQKKKQKVSSPLVSGESLSDSSQMKSDLSFEDDDAEDEVGLVIAETENKKKKTVLKKKVSSGKGKPSSPSKIKESDKKLTKRAPTAYMLFCNTSRPEIVNENPGIEFATISRKLGEMWQGLSNKQKLAWRRKAQKRLKRGSNLISTGKVPKDSQSMPTTSIHAVETPLESKLNASLTKSPRSSSEDTPQSPTNQNFSIEPIDVAAHLKLLGESLSIIGMRLQEHKGMIAVQGSLSVLLDSLLCACGPLLSLTQQVPGMDGCPPLVHAKTLDSVAYVMPGL